MNTEQGRGWKIRSPKKNVGAEVLVGVSISTGKNGPFAYKMFGERDLFANANTGVIFLKSNKETLGAVSRGEVQFGVVPILDPSIPEGLVSEVVHFWVEHDRKVGVVAEQLLNVGCGRLVRFNLVTAVASDPAIRNKKALVLCVDHKSKTIDGALEVIRSFQYKQTCLRPIDTGAPEDHCFYVEVIRSVNDHAWSPNFMKELSEVTVWARCMGTLREHNRFVDVPQSG